jgi:hypothetical protein
MSQNDSSKSKLCTQRRKQQIFKFREWYFIQLRQLPLHALSTSVHRYIQNNFTSYIRFEFGNRVLRRKREPKEDDLTGAQTETE